MGVNPVSYTLRKLLYMADAKREHNFDVAIHEVKWIMDAFHGRFDPRFANPYRSLDSIKPTTEEEKQEGWDLLFKCCEWTTKIAKGE